MITIPLRELVSVDWEEPDEKPWPENRPVYVIRDGETVFYVGRTSQGISYRVGEHLGLWGRTPGAPSEVGRLILENMPESGSWQVDLMTRRDCHDEYLRDPDASTAERAMIRKLRPCLNRQSNPNPSRLPDCYRPYAEEKDLAMQKAARSLHIPYTRRRLPGA